MSTYTSEPGTRLAGRYRLVDQVNEGAGWTYWKATDETLARSVTVLTFAAAFPRVAEAVTAARAASRLNDSRFPQVFDVEDAEEPPYVVMEWVVGESLLDMLSEGPLDPPRAAALVLEAAEAITAAHAAGLAHLRLDPACLHWTPGGGVKIAGLGIDAALTGPVLTAQTEAGPAEDADDPALTDTRDLARLLYAALTGYWPGQQGSGPGLLPPAPETDGTLCTPRQVSAGVPVSIDAVTCQALFQRPTRYGPALSTPAMFTDALASVAPPVPPPLTTSPASRHTAGARRSSPDWSTSSYAPVAETAAQSRVGYDGRRPPPRKRATAARVIVSAVVVLILAAAGVAAWSFSRNSHNSAAPPPARSSSTSPAAATAIVLKPVSASSFDVLGGPGSSEDPGGTQDAIDASNSTAWHTSYYLGSPAFGNLKKGTGLLLDMGRQVRLSQVAVQFGTTCCTHAEIEISNDNTADAAGLNSFTELQSSTTAQGVTTFNVTKNTTGRYVLIWITDLPPLPGNPGKYEAFIYDISVHGSTASQSG
ncbi:MAG: discoidin domain-containing protein [Actinomycetota bacterium]|nr:discoidin domain-containing protein [Actinomycetota bacterium]